MKKKNKIKIKFLEDAKTKRKVLKIAYIILILMILYNVIFLINTTITKQDYLQIFGTSILTMNSNNLKGEISKNSLILTKKVPETQLNTNDIVAYVINGKIRINKIFNIYQDKDTTETKIITKSNNNYYPDIEEIGMKQIIGKKILNIPFFGLIIKILQSKIVSILSLAILCFMFMFNRYAYNMQLERRRKKKKQNIN